MSCCAGSLADMVAALLGAAGGCSCGGPTFGYSLGKQVAALDIATPSPGWLVLPLEGIGKVRLLAIRSLDGASVKLRATSVNGGADQVLPISGLVVQVQPGVGDEYTALSLQGAGRVEYLLAGEA